MVDESMLSQLNKGEDYVYLSKESDTYFIEYHIGDEYDKLYSYPGTTFSEVASKFADLCKVLEYTLAP